MADLDRFPPWQGDRGYLRQVDDELWERHSIARARLRDEHGITITVVSGWRDTKQQQILYNCYRQRVATGRCPCASCNLAAPPGTSNHERGLALDLSPGPRSIPVARDIYYRMGIIFPVGPEDWHAELDPRRKPLIAPIPPTSPPAQPQERTMHTASNLDGRMEEFDIYLTRVVHRWQNGDFQSWSDWVALDPLPDNLPAVDMSVGRTHDGRLEVTAKAPAGLRFRCWQKLPGGAFDAWVPA